MQTVGRFVLAAGLLFFGVSALAAEKLQIYTEESIPSSFTKDGKLTGVSVEVVQEILRRLGEPDTIEVVPWSRGYRALQDEPNVALFATTRTPERETLFKWAGPILRLKWVFYAKKGSPIKVAGLEDAKRVKRIGTYRDDVREKFLKEKGFTNLQSVNESLQNAQKLVRGRIDLWVTSNLGAAATASAANVPMDRLQEVYVIKQADLYVAFSKQTSDGVVESWQSALEDMRTDGTFSKIYTSWLPGEQPPN